MINSQNVKYVNCIPPAAIIDNTDATVAAIDTLGFGFVTVLFSLGATDVDAVAVKLTECATSGGSYTDISGAAFAGTTGITRLPQDDDDNDLFAIQWKLGGDGLRYIKPVFTAGNGSLGTYVSAVAILDQAEIVPYDADTRGLTGMIIGSN